MFGHTAVRVVDSELGIDHSYNYGTFDYGDPLFVPHFIQGNLNYFLSVVSFPAAIRHYSRVENRTVIEQRLDLSQSEKQSLLRYLALNALPENREYRYDFLYDNCSTRVLDALDSVLVLQLPDGIPDHSFREMLNPYLQKRRAVKAGIDLSFGSEVDQLPSRRQQSFLPDALMDLLDNTVVESDGITRPLVARKDTLFTAVAPESRTPWLFIAGWLLVGIQLVLTILRPRGSLLLDLIVFAVVGLAGCLLVYMWFGTRHTVTAWNINLLWAAPTHLLYAIYRARSSSTNAVHRYYPLLAFIAISIYLLGSGFGPFFSIDTLPLVLITTASAARFYINSKRTAPVLVAE